MHIRSLKPIISYQKKILSYKIFRLFLFHTSSFKCMYKIDTRTIWILKHVIKHNHSFIRFCIHFLSNPNFITQTLVTLSDYGTVFVHLRTTLNCSYIYVLVHFLFISARLYIHIRQRHVVQFNLENLFENRLMHAKLSIFLWVEIKLFFYVMR
jgi:hypothetical protein